MAPSISQMLFALGYFLLGIRFVWLSFEVNWSRRRILIYRVLGALLIAGQLSQAVEWLTR